MADVGRVTDSGVRVLRVVAVVVGELAVVTVGEDDMIVAGGLKALIVQKDVMMSRTMGGASGAAIGFAASRVW